MGQRSQRVANQNNNARPMRYDREDPMWWEHGVLVSEPPGVEFPQRLQRTRIHPEWRMSGKLEGRGLQDKNDRAQEQSLYIRMFYQPVTPNIGTSLTAEIGFNRGRVMNVFFGD